MGARRSAVGPTDSAGASRAGVASCCRPGMTCRGWVRGVSVVKSAGGGHQTTSWTSEQRSRCAHAAAVRCRTSPCGRPGLRGWASGGGAVATRKERTVARRHRGRARPGRQQRSFVRSGRQLPRHGIRGGAHVVLARGAVRSRAPDRGRARRRGTGRIDPSRAWRGPRHPAQWCEPPRASCRVGPGRRRPCTQGHLGDETLRPSVAGTGAAETRCASPAAAEGSPRRSFSPSSRRCAPCSMASHAVCSAGLSHRRAVRR